jgi:lipid-binding SYLF domain-containing protein
MMRRWLVIALGLLCCSQGRLAAGPQEAKTVESAAEVVRALSEIPLKGIPRTLLHDAAGVVIVPQVLKVGLLIDRRFGRGVVVVHEANGAWSNPIFVTLDGAGIGGQAGIEKTELVLVFKSRKSLDKALQGKLALGGDASIAAGPIGREAEVATDRKLKADIYSYSRSKGLFAGVSLQGASLRFDGKANDGFYGFRDCRVANVFAYRGAPIAAAEALKAELARLSGSPAPPLIIVPLPTAPPPVYPPPLPLPPPPRERGPG